MNHKLKLWIYSILIIILIASYFRWIDNRDKKLAKSIKIYEQCVKEKYDTTPAAYRVEHGEYPYCK